MKYYIIILAVFLIAIFYYSIDCASEINNSDELITVIQKTDSPEDRKKIYETYRDKMGQDFIISMLSKTHDNELSYQDCNQLIERAIEISEFTGDTLSLAQSLLYYIHYEGRERKTFLVKALELFRENNDKKGEGLCYLLQARGLKLGLIERDKAFELIERALKIFQDRGDTLLEGECYSTEAYYYGYLNEKDKAIEYYNRAIDIYERKGFINGVLNCYRNMIELCRLRGALEEALEYIDREKHIIEEIEPDKIKEFYSEEDGYFIYKNWNMKKDKQELLFDCYMVQGGIYCDMGRYDDAIKSYEMSIQIADNLYSYLKMEPYELLGTIYINLGQKDMALYYYSTYCNNIENIFKSDKLPVYKISDYYMNAGDFYMNMMDMPEEGIKYYKLAISNSKEFYRKTACMLNIGNYYRQKKDFSSALKAYKEILALCDEGGIANNKRPVEFMIGEVLYLTGSLYKEQGEYNLAANNIEESAKLYEIQCKDFTRFRYELVYRYESLEEIYEALGQREKALEYRNKAFETADKSKKKILRDYDYYYSYLGRFYLKTGNFSGAYEAYDKAIEIEEKISYPSVWKTSFSAGKSFEEHGRLQEAYRFYSKAIESIENMRHELKIEEFKRDFMKDKIEVYEYMINLLMKMKREKEAFSYNEKARARAFLDILGNQKIETFHEPELADREEDLNRRIQCLSDNLREEEKKAEQNDMVIHNMEEELNELKLKYQQLLQEIKLKNPEYMTLISVNPLSLEDIQALLDKDTVIIEYFLGKDRLYIWVTGNETFDTISINKGNEEINNLVRSFRALVCENMNREKLKNNKWHDISRELYDILFKDIDKYISGKKRLLIAPHRILHYLPFQILTDEKGKMLLDEYEITYLPSASVLKYCRDKNTLQRSSLLAFELGNFKIKKFAPLPGTEKEVAAVSNFFASKEIYSNEYMKTNILYDRGKNFDILHFATHGILDDSSPLFSSLVFADRELKVYEIFELSLKSYLVCLSACKTGLGEEVCGDELVGLSRAFIYAGTPTVCSSLWDVSDISTAEFMEHFYFYLQSKNKSEALRLAQMEIREKYGHPFFWASFVLTGDWK